MADHHPGLAHPLVAGIDHQVGKGFAQGRELGQTLITVVLLIVLIEDAAKLSPHNSSVSALTLPVETPCTYISTSAATNARAERC
jgi:hypothetical protein